MAIAHPARTAGKTRPAPPVRKRRGKKASPAMTKHGVLTDPKEQFSDDEWQDMVSTAAYYRAESRGFEGGSPEDDWYEAEAELREQLAGAEETFDMDETPEPNRNDLERRGE